MQKYASTVFQLKQEWRTILSAILVECLVPSTAVTLNSLSAQHCPGEPAGVQVLQSRFTVRSCGWGIQRDDRVAWSLFCNVTPILLVNTHYKDEGVLHKWWCNSAKKPKSPCPAQPTNIKEASVLRDCASPRPLQHLSFACALDKPVFGPFTSLDAAENTRRLHRNSNRLSEQKQVFDLYSSTVTVNGLQGSF